MDHYWKGTWVAFALAIGATGLMMAIFYDRFWWPPDEGIYAHIAERILAGEVLNQDVQDIHPGYINFINATSFWLFGSRLVSLRYPLILITFLQACLVFYIFLRQGSLTALASSLSITALGVLQFLNPTAHWYCLFLFICLIGSLRLIPQKAPWRLPFLGLLLGLIFFFRQLSGVIVAMGVLVYLLLEDLPSQNRGRQSVWSAKFTLGCLATGLGYYLMTHTNLIGFLLFGLYPLILLFWALVMTQASNKQTHKILFEISKGAVLASLPLVGYHVFHGSLSFWLNDMILSAMELPQLHFILERDFSLWILGGLLEIWKASSVVSVLNGIFWTFLPFLALVNGVLVLWAIMRRKNLAIKEEMLPILGVFYGLVSVHYQIPIYLFYTVGISLLGIIWQLPKNTSWKNFGLFMVLVFSLVGLTFQAAEPLTRGSSGILAGKRVPLLRSDSLKRSGLQIDEIDVKKYSEIIQVIEKRTRPGEYIFALPNQSELYFLSERANPFRFYNTAIGIKTSDDLKKVLHYLQHHPPKLVIYNPTDKYNTEASRLVMDGVRVSHQFIGKIGDLECFLYAKTG